MTLSDFEVTSCGHKGARPKNLNPVACEAITQKSVTHVKVKGTRYIFVSLGPLFLFLAQERIRPDDTTAEDRFQSHSGCSSC